MFPAAAAIWAKDSSRPSTSSSLDKAATEAITSAPAWVELEAVAVIDNRTVGVKAEGCREHPTYEGSAARRIRRRRARDPKRWEDRSRSTPSATMNHPNASTPFPGA